MHRPYLDFHSKISAMKSSAKPKIIDKINHNIVNCGSKIRFAALEITKVIANENKTIAATFFPFLFLNPSERPTKTADAHRK